MVSIDPSVQGRRRGAARVFGRILAEHMQTTSTCRAWLGEVDYVISAPAAAARTAERGIDIVARTGNHLSWRLGIPLRETSCGERRECHDPGSSEKGNSFAVSVQREERGGY